MVILDPARSRMGTNFVKGNANVRTHTCALDSVNVRFKMWEASLIPKFESFLPSALARSFGEVAAVVVLFSQADRSSFDEAQKWASYCQELAVASTAGKMEASVVMVFVGVTPPQGSGKKAEVKTDEAVAYADSVGALYLEVPSVMVVPKGPEEKHVLNRDTSGQLLNSVAENLLQNAIARREAEEVRAKATSELNTAMHPTGWFAKVDSDLLFKAIEAAKEAGVNPEMVAEAEEKLAEATAKRGWCGIRATTRLTYGEGSKGQDL